MKCKLNTISNKKFWVDIVLIFIKDLSKLRSMKAMKEQNLEFYFSFFVYLFICSTKKEDILIIIKNTKLFQINNI